ncbi:metal ABC transporter solute-binding protein, Zn/Mn family [Agrobacterium vaccinii]|uniref:metal ABC transporter solute-binding protein, Zn/Mn family n=1 Tax=Agrobacterium vaccinii TaxID=2735528 RepID=UPI003D68856C
MTEACLTFDNLTLGYDHVLAEHHMNGAVRKGKLKAVVGGNGSGKSTLMKVITGLLGALSSTCLISEMREAAVFAEYISDARLVEQIALEAGLKLGGTLYSDALSPANGPAPTYIQMMLYNFQTLTSADNRG